MCLSQDFWHVLQTILFEVWSGLRKDPFMALRCNALSAWKFAMICQRQASKILYMDCMCAGIWVLVQGDADLRHFPTQARAASCTC